MTQICISEHFTFSNKFDLSHLRVLFFGQEVLVETFYSLELPIVNFFHPRATSILRKMICYLMKPIQCGYNNYSYKIFIVIMKMVLTNSWLQRMLAYEK